MARIKTKIRKGDTVVVVTGRERGKSGKVLSVDTVAGDLVHETSGELRTFEREISYYHGVEGGEAWSEGGHGEVVPAREA